MKLNIHLSKKKLLAISAIALASVLCLTALALPRAGARPEEAMRREYPVEKGNIIVGVDAAGTISSEKHAQFTQYIARIKEYKVKPGDKISEGDILAEFAQGDIDERLKAAEGALLVSGLALDKLQAEKQNAGLEADKKLHDAHVQGDDAYAQKVSAHDAKMQALKTGLTEKQAALQKIIDEIAAIKAAKDAPIAPEAAPIPEPDVKALEEKKAALEAELLILNADISALASEREAIDDARQREKSALAESDKLLKSQGNIQQKDYQGRISEAKAKYASDKLLRDRLLTLQKDPTVKAECGGVVLSLGYAQNAVAAPETPIAELGPDSKKILLLEVDPADITEIQLSQKVSFYVDAYQSDTFYGTVRSKSYLQNKNGKFDVTVAYDSPAQELLDGMGANATLIVKEKSDILTLSNKAIILEDNKSYVNVVNENNELVKKPVKTGFSNGRITEIEGLAEGDIAVIEERYEDK